MPLSFGGEKVDVPQNTADNPQDIADVVKNPFTANKIGNMLEANDANEYKTLADKMNMDPSKAQDLVDKITEIEGKITDETLKTSLEQVKALLTVAANAQNNDVEQRKDINRAAIAQDVGVAYDAATDTFSYAYNGTTKTTTMQQMSAQGLQISVDDFATSLQTRKTTQEKSIDAAIAKKQQEELQKKATLEEQNARDIVANTVPSPEVMNMASVKAEFTKAGVSEEDFSQLQHYMEDGNESGIKTWRNEHNTAENTIVANKVTLRDRYSNVDVGTQYNDKLSFALVDIKTKAENTQLTEAERAVLKEYCDNLRSIQTSLTDVDGALYVGPFKKGEDDIEPSFTRTIVNLIRDFDYVYTPAEFTTPQEYQQSVNSYLEEKGLNTATYNSLAKKMGRNTYTGTIV